MTNKVFGKTSFEVYIKEERKKTSCSANTQTGLKVVR